MVVIATTFSFSVWAKPRSLEQARAIAARHAREMGIVQSLQGAPRKVKSQVNRASTSAQSYYVFENGGNKGYTIVPGDDRLPDIVGYSCNGSYEEAYQPEAFREYMKVLVCLTEQLERGDSVAIKQAQKLKERQRSSAETNRIKVSPLLGKIEWNQYAPYNEQCPKNGSRRCLTGCSPTAMAQILAYYRYPASMLKDTPAYTSSWNGYTTKVPSRSKGKPYDWDAMLPSYKGQYTQRQADAVAQLMADCGAAMGALYTPEATGASASVEVFRDYFGYDGDLLQFLKHTGFTQAEWETIIDRELLASRPICYAGVNGDGGHAFVCDGADGNGFYHINWGWDGAYNGYFDLSILNYDYPGSVNSNVDDGFNKGQTIFVGIAPDNGKYDVPLNVVPGIVSVSPEISIEGIVAYENYFFIRINFVVPPKMDVYLAMGIKDENGGYKVLTDGMHYDATQIETYSTVRYEEDKRMDLPLGKVDVVPIYSTDGKNWQPCGGREEQTHYRFLVTDTSTERVFSTLSATLNVEGPLYSQQKNVINFTFQNDKDADIFTSLPMAITNSKEKPSKYDRTITVSVPAHSSKSRSITLEPMSAGTYYVWLKNECNSVWFAEQFKNSFCMEAQPISIVDYPQLSLMGAGTNKAEGETETSNAYYTIDLVDAPLTHDDKARFYFTLRNIGGDCDATVKAFMSIWRGYNDMDSSYTAEKQVTLVGNGAETKVVFETDADSSAEKGYFAVCQLQNIDVAGTVFQLKNKDTLPNNYLYILPKRRLYYPFDISTQYVYVSGKSSAVGSTKVAEDCVVGIGKGYIMVKTTKDRSLYIYDVGGRLVKSLYVRADVLQRVALPAGVYVVEDRKVVVN